MTESRTWIQADGGGTTVGIKACSRLINAQSQHDLHSTELNGRSSGHLSCMDSNWHPAQPCNSNKWPSFLSSAAGLCIQTYDWTKRIIHARVLCKTREPDEQHGKHCVPDVTLRSRRNQYKIQQAGCNPPPPLLYAGSALWIRVQVMGPAVEPGSKVQRRAGLKGLF